jgi:uncharacterized protein (TIGR03084 family)
LKGDVDTSQDRVRYQRLGDDLVAEEEALDDVVVGIDDASWAVATPAQGWDVHDQIAHLAASEDLAALAASDPLAFGAELTRLLSSPGGPELEHLQRTRAMTPSEVLRWWRTARSRTVAALGTHDPTDRLPWAGPDMSAMSFASARLMETWAHGQDIVDALGIERMPTDRLFHVALLGVRTRRFSYVNRGLPFPVGEVRVELLSPGGRRWVWGDAGAMDRVTGPALDFCLVVTQRRWVGDTNLDVIGDAANEWMAIAQTFAGPPTNSRTAREP